MKVLLATQAWPPAGGGAEVCVAALARHLAREHEVAALYRTAEPGLPDHEVRVEEREGVRLFAVNNLHRAAPGFEAYRDPGLTRAALRVIEEVGPEVLHVHHLNGLSTGLVFAARERGVPVVITLHDFWPACPLGQLFTLKHEVCPGPTPRRCLGCVGGQVAGPRPRAGVAPAARAAARVPLLAGLANRGAALLGRGAGRVQERLDEMHEVLRAADALLSPSQFLADRLAALGFPRARLLRNGLEPLAVRRVEGEGRLRVGFVGLGIPSKGVHVLAAAAGRLDAAAFDVHIHGPFVPFHGDHGYEARVRAVLGARADAVLRGPFAHAELGRVLGELDVMVVPSLWEENAPVTVQEAFAAGVVPVVSDQGGLREVVSHGVDGLRFAAGDAAALAGALERLQREPALLAALRAAAPAPVTLAAHAAETLQAYAEARSRFGARPGRPGVVVLDCGTPEAAARAAHSAREQDPAPEVVVVENGPGPAPAGVPVVALPANRGFAGGMNAGLAHLRARGCDRVLLLNSDAVLAAGSLRRLAEAVDEPGVAAAGPVVLRGADGRVESRGVRLDLHSGRHHLRGHGEAADPREGRERVESLSGAALMLRLDAVDLIGPLDEDYFFAFEDTDWCLRARAAGLEVVLVRGARVHHEGSRTIGAASADRLYYAARNHLRAVQRLAPRRGPAEWARRLGIVALNLAHAARRGRVPRREGLRAVLQGILDYQRGRFGPRTQP